MLALEKTMTVMRFVGTHVLPLLDCLEVEAAGMYCRPQSLFHKKHSF